MGSQPASGGAAMNEETGQETGQGSGNASLDIELKSIIADVLGLETEQANELEEDSGLFGHLPELDSMAVAGLLTEIEDRLDIVIEDEDVDGEMLETYGGLLAFVEGKLNPDSEEG